jgi:hypothetical protein
MAAHLGLKDPDQIVITDEWAVAQGKGAVFHWTTALPMRREGDKVIVEGRRGRNRSRWRHR